MICRFKDFCNLHLKYFVEDKNGCHFLSKDAKFYRFNNQVLYFMPYVLRKISNNIIGRFCESEGFYLSDINYPAGLQQPRHVHECASFSYALAGNYLENYGRRGHLRQPSTIVFRPPGEAHAVEFQTEVRIFSVQFDFERLEQIRQWFVLLNEPASFRSETIARLGNRIHREFERMDEFSMMAIEGLTLEILAEASRCEISQREKSFPRWLALVTDFLRDSFAEQTTIQEIAALADVHPAHLSRVFRRKHGCTISEYVRRLRVEFVCREISKTDASLSEIAVAAGFSDQSHLNKTFKNLCGLTPAEYRKNQRKMSV